MADIDELLEFDFEGKLQHWTSFREALARLASDHNGDRAELVTLASPVGNDWGIDSLPEQVYGHDPPAL